MTVAKDFTPRKVGITIVVMEHLSLSYSVILRTVVPKVPRPRRVGDKVGLFPRDPGYLGAQSVAGTVHAVCPRSSEVREGEGEVTVYKAGPDATPDPPVVPSAADPLVESLTPAFMEGPPATS